MSGYVVVECDADRCLSEWSSDDYADGDDFAGSANVQGAFRYLADIEGWVRRDGKVYCSTACAESGGSA